ncbi:hypothetical protein [Mycetocola sp.]|uniref:hypothetical protein n=1 Tax=Mycetocola sp. TaxID=1871042 RepID=UPI003989B87D
MSLRAVSVALGGIALAALLSGCDARAEVSAELRESIPKIAEFSEVATMADLREFNEPSADLRARFTSSGEVYRVIDSSIDRARIALWRIDVPGPGPGPFDPDPDRGFTAEELVVGTACASIERAGDTVTSAPFDCPHPLAARSPTTEVASWTRDAAAVWEVQLGASSLNQDVRWLLFHNDDGSQPRHESLDADAVVAVIKKARLSSADTSISVAVEDVAQEGSHITGLVRIAASAPEEVNTTKMSAATGCFVLDIDLQLQGQYGLWEPLNSARC